MATYETPVVLCDWADKPAKKAFLWWHVAMSPFYIAAIALAQAALPEQRPLALAVVAGVGLLQAGISLWTWRDLVLLSPTSLLLDGAGLEMRSPKGRLRISWADLKSWRLTSMNGYTYVLEAVSKDGRAMRFPGCISGFGKVRNLDELVEQLQARAGHLHDENRTRPRGDLAADLGLRERTGS